MATCETGASDHCNEIMTRLDQTIWNNKITEYASFSYNNTALQEYYSIIIIVLCYRLLTLYFYLEALTCILTVYFKINT